MFYVKLNEFDNLKKIEKEKKDELDKKNKYKIFIIINNGKENKMN